MSADGDSPCLESRETLGTRPDVDFHRLTPAESERGFCRTAARQNLKEDFNYYRGISFSTSHVLGENSCRTIREFPCQTRLPIYWISELHGRGMGR